MSHYLFNGYFKTNKSMKTTKLLVVQPSQMV